MGFRKKTSLSLVVILSLMIFLQTHTYAQTPSTSISFNQGTQYIQAANLPINTALNGKNTVEFWLNWNGQGAMPFSWKGTNYDLIATMGWLGFNTGQGDILGVSFPYANQWVHVAAVFNNGVVNTSTMKIYINGDLQNIVYAGGFVPPTTTRNATGGFQLSGWDQDGTHRFGGSIANLVIYNHERTNAQVRQDMISAPIVTGMVGKWNLDQFATGEVFDQTSNSNDGICYGYSTPLSISSLNSTDLGMDIDWNQVSGATGYELTRDGAIIYDGTSTSYVENALVSDTTYNYSIRAKNTNGKTVSKAQAFKTNVGELALISVPTAFSLTPKTLNGVSQKSYGTFGSKIIVKDTRKVRNGWNLTVKASPLKSTDGLRTFPNNKIQLKPVSNITQTQGKIASSASIINALQTIDGASAMKIVSAAAVTGQGVYEITLPASALELTVDPANAYARNYETNLTWNLVAGP